MGLIIQSLVVFILIASGLLILGFGANSWLIALFAGIINIIPYIGPIIGMLFGMLIGITTNLSVDPGFDITPMLIQLFILFQGVQLIDNFVSQPIIYSNSIKAHPLEVFFVVLVFGNLAGVPGMIAAMPVYAFFRIIAKEFFSEAKIVRKNDTGTRLVTCKNCCFISPKKPNPYLLRLWQISTYNFVYSTYPKYLYKHRFFCTFMLKSHHKHTQLI
ncbi:MAG: AI-2E family transporter [Bacteroidetes bacterium]|nr:AI-2E family transporter [Bacteroidota bacterium]